ncbi:MAG: cytochrome c-552 precursor [Gammaproteobacteria bacterium]|nr:cytochrome c-552 precursor [Gammaproteobacteria bacterium]
MSRHVLTGKMPGQWAVFAFLCAASAAAPAVDWNGVEGRQVMLFFPGQASWEWALTQADHSGAKKFREGKNCRECHAEEEKDIGDKIASGKKLEPNPVAGKPGSVSVNVKTAHDGERLYVRLQWQEPARSQGAKMDPDFESKITMMLDDGSVSEAVRSGCWGACHDDAVGMASAAAGSELTKYLARSRTKVARSGGGENYKPAAELDQLLQQGVFMEFWQAKLNKGAAPLAVDGYILDQRHKNETPAIQAEGGMEGGAWTVTLSRKLSGAGPRHKDIVPGKTYSVGFALHSDHAEHRFHHISFEHTLAVDQGKADFVAVKK